MNAASTITQNDQRNGMDWKNAPQDVGNWLGGIAIGLLGAQGVWRKFTEGRRDTARLAGELDIIQKLRKELEDSIKSREAADEEAMHREEHLQQIIAKLQDKVNKLQNANLQLSALTRRQEAQLAEFESQNSQFRDSRQDLDQQIHPKEGT